MIKRYGVQFTMTKEEVKAIKMDERNDRNAFDLDAQRSYSFHVEFEPIDYTHTTMVAYVFTYEMPMDEVKSEIEKLFNKKADFVFQKKGI